MDAQRFTQLMAFWRSVEAFSPQAIPKAAPSDPREPARNWAHGALLPWTEPAFARRPIPPARAWRHSVYGVVIERAQFVKRLEQLLGKQPDVYEERLNGESAVFFLAVDEHGRPLAESLTISMAAWAFGVVAGRGLAALDAEHACDVAGLHRAPFPLELPSTNSGFPGFDIQAGALREELAWRIGQLAPGEGIDGPWLADFAELVVDKLGLDTLVLHAPSHRVKSVQVRRPKPNETAAAPKADDDFLNSFFIRDLNRVAAAGLEQAGPALQGFLEAPPQMARLDVRIERQQALALLDPSRFPAGCWPAEHPLVWSQQLAINSLWNKLAQAGSFAVNGPPGTGKTTLLRDVVAAVVVERARVLASKGSQVFAEPRSIEIGPRKVPYFALDPALSGFSIVVASSNNGAVENLSLELPSETAIDPQWLGEADLYKDIAGELLQKPAWALIAGRLGNKANRSAFSNSFWWQASDDGKQVPGLRERLEALKQGKAAPALSWDDARAGFEQALEQERGWRERIGALGALPVRLAQLESKRRQAEADREPALEQQHAARDAVAEWTRQLQDGEAAVRQSQAYQAGLRDIRPGWLDWLRSFGGAQRAWRARMAVAVQEQRDLEGANAATRRHLKQATHTLAQCDALLAGLDSELARLSAQVSEAERELKAGKELLGAHWPDLQASASAQEKSSPWAHPEWRRARIRVFIAALRLHRAFIEEHAQQMTTNLGLAMYMLSGNVAHPGARSVALDSLALACPVLSTTFASAASLFGELGPGSIGWLLIDEAGQAPPQAAAGSIWRAARTVVVGDPLQLEPVVTLPRSVEASLAACYGAIGPQWLPTRTSVQALADRGTAIGTMVGKGDDAIWVGAPLRVHRRCDNPMFSISNAIAYDGLMVHQKKPAAVEWPASAWIDVAQGNSDGNWLPAEGEALRELLGQLIQANGVDPASIFLISPFRDVVQKIRNIGKAFGLDSGRVGTVHTTQGKESEVVILVVGGGTSGARAWVAGKPNLLNVAVSRAKARLYVIGNRRDLTQRPYFDVLAKQLPVMAAPSLAGSTGR